MAFTLHKQVRKDDALRENFMDLARRVFGLSFADWYAAGWWGDRYIPYVLAQGGRVVSCAAVNPMDFRLEGRRRRYIQIGTVMTDPGFRGKGLARRLLEEILADWQGKADGVYLFANDTVLNFYPRFGFRQAAEVQYTLPVSPGPGDFVPLDTGSPAGQEILRRCYAKSNPFSSFSMEDNLGLIMFWCGCLPGCAYYSPSMDTVVLAEREGDTLFCHDIFGHPGRPLGEVLAGLCRQESRAELGFAPAEAGDWAVTPLAGEDTLFVLAGGENPCAGRRLRFPSLSHA